ncbi:hypothetical protein ACWD25_08550 [Streptomyces sp. NPDC002920]
MRGPSVRRIASTALCASLVLGIAAPAAMAADGDPARQRTAREADHGRLTPERATQLSTAVDDAVAKVRAAKPAKAAAADPLDDALADLQTQLDELLDTVASGVGDQILPTVTGLVSGLLVVVDGLLASLGVSLPDLLEPPLLPVDPSAVTLPTGS